MLSAGWQEGRRLVSSETPCICNCFSLEMLVCPTVEVAPKRWLFFRGSFAFHLRQAHFLITPGGHSECPIFLIFSSFLLISQLMHGTSVEIRLVLSMSRFFYCEEQSLEGIICWLVDTFVVYCIHVKHTFEDYITQQTYVQQCNAQSAILLSCGLHLDWLGSGKLAIL